MLFSTCSIFLHTGPKNNCQTNAACFMLFLLNDEKGRESETLFRTGIGRFHTFSFYFLHFVDQLLIGWPTEAAKFISVSSEQYSAFMTSLL
ncbi:unnamed protein product [Arctogadus glacialis]